VKVSRSLMGASTILWTLTPPCFTLRAAGYGGSFFSPVPFSIFSSASPSDHARPHSRGPSPVFCTTERALPLLAILRLSRHATRRPPRAARQVALGSTPTRATRRRAPQAPPPRQHAQFAKAII